MVICRCDNLSIRESVKQKNYIHLLHFECLAESVDIFFYKAILCPVKQASTELSVHVSVISKSKSSWWFFPTHLKNMLIKLDHFPK